MRLVALLSPSLLLLLAAGGVACERSKTEPKEPVEDIAKPETSPDTAINTVKVTDNIYMLVGRGGNVGVSVGSDGVLVIDDKFADLAKPLRAAITALSKDKVVYVLNTHHHGDHTGGNVALASEATLVSHENARKHLVAQDTPAAGLPVITFSKSMSIHFNGERIDLVHLPNGHTDGDSAIYFRKSNVVHLGDNFFNGRLPFVDLDSGGDPSVLLASTKALLEKLPADVKLIPGHGDLATIEDLRRFRDMLEDTIATVTAAKKAGKNLEQVKKAAFGGKYKAMETSFVPEPRWAEIIYKSLD